MQYLLQKILDARFIMEPFKHIYIDNFFNDNDFSFLTNTPQIKLPMVASDQELCKSLAANGWSPISFPGCTTDPDSYIQWHSGASKKYVNVDTCEGFGMAYRLNTAANERLQEFRNFFLSDDFFRVLAERLDVDFEKTTKDAGIQKYLDGYEISPHPDIRKKAVTFMININPALDSEALDHHTRYLRFKPEWQYVRQYWVGHPHVDTCWTPWDWCETVYQQNKNNSIVIFSPDESTMHGVRASYDHLPAQRTQVYGNLWYEQNPATTFIPCWENFVISLTEQRLKGASIDNLPQSKVSGLGKLLSRIKNKSRSLQKIIRNNLPL